MFQFDNDQKIVGKEEKKNPLFVLHQFPWKALPYFHISSVQS